MLTVFTILTTLVITVCAIEPNQVQSVLEFEQTKKAYPIADSVENAVGFFDYYNISITEKIHFEKSYEDTSFSFSANRSANSLTINASINGSYPTFYYMLIDGAYKDFAISYDGDNLVVIGFVDGRKVIVNSDLNIDFYNTPGNELIYFSQLLYDSPTEGYYIEYPSDQEENSIVSSITVSVTTFVIEVSSVFVNAFNLIFISNGSISSVGIFLLTMFGVALGYVIVRFITYLFRKES